MCCTSPVLFPGALEEPWRQYLSTTVAPSRCFLGASFFFSFSPETPSHAFAFLPPTRPYLEEPRNVIVHKGAEPLGISIVSGENGGIFVSKVTGGSIAHQAGLEYGDQLLEVRTTDCQKGSCRLERSSPPDSLRGKEQRRNRRMLKVPDSTWDFSKGSVFLRGINARLAAGSPHSLALSRFPVF